MQAQDLTGTPFIDLGFLIARVLVGLLMAAHGAQKLFGWFGGHGLQATGEFFGQLGFHPARLFAGAAALGELASGLLIALGLFGPVGPALMLAVMVVAAITVHWRNGLFAATNGIRSEEHTSELQSPTNLVCRLLLEKKK